MAMAYHRGTTELLLKFFQVAPKPPASTYLGSILTPRRQNTRVGRNKAERGENLRVPAHANHRAVHLPLPSPFDMGILDVALGGPLIGSFVNSMLFMLEIVQARHDVQFGSRLV
jgi:hypothetical protein